MDNIILQATVGSTAHGLALEGTDDRDELGVYLEPIEHVVGFHDRETIIQRTAAVREGRHDAPSQPGDVDLTLHSLRKFCRLALKGNPTILILLFAPPELCSVCQALGGQLQDLAPDIVSRRAGSAFLGYLQAQRQRLTGERGQKNVRRPELEAKYGFDTKYAMYMLRLGIQGIELLQTGRMTLPMAEPERSKLMDVRTGHIPLTDCLTWAGELEHEIRDLLDTSPLPEKPNEAKIEQWMCNVYLHRWKATEASMWVKA